MGTRAAGVTRQVCVKPGVAARRAAAAIISRVLRSGAYSNIVARTETASLPEPEARFARRLAFDTLRHLSRIDRAIRTASDRPLDQIDAPVLDALRVGAAEALTGTGAPHAIADGTVEVVRIVRPAAVGFANAVLRRLLADGEPPLPDGAAGEALRAGQPRWLYRRMVEAWGKDDATAFFLASQQPAPRTARWRPGATRDPRFPGIPEAIFLEEGELPHGLIVQDPASVAVGLAVAAQPGDRVLDLAAAPGGKTLHLADQLAGSGLLVATDLHEARARRARRRSEGIRIHWCVADGTRAPFADETFDRILVDAPCTGLGTLRRRPEIRYRLRPGDPARMAIIQRHMLEEALRMVKPGGTLVYSVCTVTPEETTGVVGGFDAAPPDGLPGRRWGGGLLMAPHLTGTDGMFIAVLRP